MSQKEKDCKNGFSNKYIQYYPAEGKNDAFNKHNGATRRAIETRASLNAAAIVGAKKFPKGYEGQLDDWLENPHKYPDLEKEIKITFVKECERLALLPDKELEKMRSREEDLHLIAPTSKVRNSFYRADINNHMDMLRD